MNRDRSGRRSTGEEDVSLASSIRGYLATEGLSDLDTYARVAAVWADVVGERVAQHAQPEALHGGELRVTVDQPAWATEFRFLTDQVLSELQNRLGKQAVSAVKVHVRA